MLIINELKIKKSSYKTGFFFNKKDYFNNALISASMEASLGAFASY